ncbi:MAG: hypothetical protein SV186_03640 [Candidatus Nanohaloarchaea archaeon]|nr:hypothetical protein [Candidatus Nanohaloarchaea archaeon]
MDEREIIEHEVKQLRHRDDVRAVAIVGSYARDPDSEHNDIDLYIIVDGDWRQRETEVVDGTVVERFYNSMGWSRDYLDGEGWYKNYHWYTNADIRYDPEGLFDELAEAARMKRDDHLNLDEEERQSIQYFIWDLQQDIEQADGSQAAYLRYKLFDYLLEKHYLLQDETPVKENYRVEHLQDFDETMHDLATRFLDAPPDKQGAILDDMVDHVTADLGDPDPEWQTAEEVR